MSDHKCPGGVPGGCRVCLDRLRRDGYVPKFCNIDTAVLSVPRLPTLRSRLLAAWWAFWEAQ